ncbi:MAG: phytanoyl-CoA dioxygenase family protein [Alphaproteobacteria bacterium]|nr:phytanoyl-CoA dioxygenase family protein [Alphaproteobacteria bacterium]MBV8410986.1 phytanoyl-CoA dioxygenase family protein [Alphaproteobacteria bacterium]
MAFTQAHWHELIGQGYTVVSDLIDDQRLRSAQDAASHLNAVHPDQGWERTRNELWREIRHCPDPAFEALATGVLEPLASEILETVHSPERIQLASTLPGFETRGGVGRNFHIDGGKQPSLAAFNVLFGVALTPVASNTAGGFHVLPGSHDRFAEMFRSQPPDTPVHWGEVKLAGQQRFLAGARMVVPRLNPGDVIVAHSFLAHGTSANRSDVRRDMIFQRRAAIALCDPVTRAEAREAFMRDHWSFFRIPASVRIACRESLSC